MKDKGDDGGKGRDGGEGKGGRPSGEFDPWDTDKGLEYDPDTFYTRSTNRHDHSVDIRFKLPPHISSRINEIVSQGYFPQLRSGADFYRDACIHRLHYLNEIVGSNEIEHSLSTEMRVCRIAQQQEELEKMLECVTAHEDLMKRSAETNDYLVLQSVIVYAEDDIEVLRQPYKNQLIKLTEEYREKLIKALRDSLDD